MFLSCIFYLIPYCAYLYVSELPILCNYSLSVFLSAGLITLSNNYFLFKMLNFLCNFNINCWMFLKMNLKTLNHIASQFLFFIFTFKYGISLITKISYYCYLTASNMFCFSKVNMKQVPSFLWGGGYSVFFLAVVGISMTSYQVLVNVCLKNVLQ